MNYGSEFVKKPFAAIFQFLDCGFGFRHDGGFHFSRIHGFLIIAIGRTSQELPVPSGTRLAYFYALRFNRALQAIAPDCPVFLLGTDTFVGRKVGARVELATSWSNISEALARHAFSSFLYRLGYPTFLPANVNELRSWIESWPDVCRYREQGGGFRRLANYQHHYPRTYFP